MSAFGQGAGSSFGASQQTGSLFGQPQQQNQGFGQPATGSGLFGSTAAPNTGSNAFGQPSATTGGSLFGAKRSNSFGGSSSTQAGSGGLFGGTNTTSGGLFGQTQPQTQPQTQTGGLFGSASNTTNSGMFGQNKPATTGGLFGSTNQSQPQTGGLFGQSTQPSTGFGQTSQPASSGFGQKPGLFGQTNQPSTGFGQTNQQPATGGLFGQNNQTQPSTGSLFGQSNQPSTGFGQTNQQQQPASGGLFGSRPATTTGGFGFGNTQTQTQPQTQSTFGSSLGGSGSGGLFGSKPATTGTGGGLFGNTASQPKPLFGQTTQSQPQTQQSGGFSLFNGPQSQQQQQQQQQGQQGQQGQPQQLYASIDQAPYGTNTFVQKGISGSDSVPTRDFSHTRERGHQLYSSLLPSANRAKTSDKNQTSGESASVAGAESGSVSLIPQSTKTVQQYAPQGSQQKWMNSYQDFLALRPSTLVIRRDSVVHKPLLLENGPDATANPDESNVVDFSVANVPAAAESSHIDNGERSVANGTFIAHSTVNPANVSSVNDGMSIFHRQANTVTLVRVNKRALEMGYFMRPSLEQLASLSKRQLSSVSNLVIGREGYGQIEYPSPVDLSSIQNLGDILGGLVVFDAGTVDVYPDESTHKPPGRELNLPSIVTIEQAWPRDPISKEPITNMADPRMTRHIERLRKACEARGGEFVTFAHGVWVFKVPHFSRWGLSADELVLDEDANDFAMDGPEVIADDYESVLMPRGDVEIAQPDTKKIRIDDDDDMDEALEDEDMPEGLRQIVSATPGTPESIDFLDGDDLGEPADWVSQLQHASKGLLAASAQAVEAASKPVLNLGDVLFGNETAKPDGGLRSRNPWLATAASTASGVCFRPPRQPAGPLLSHAYLLSRSKRVERRGSDLPLLETKLGFDALPGLTSNNSIWTLATIMYSPESRIALSSWLEQRVDERVRADVSRATTDLDAIWAYVSGHKLEEAAARAVASGNPHLAVLVATLDQPSTWEDAAGQLKDWKQGSALQYIPTGIRRIWSLAGSHEFRSIDDWERQLGMKLWYSNSSVADAVKTLPTAEPTGSELALIRAAASPKQDKLLSALAQLSDVEAFLFLLALPEAYSDLLDRVAHNLSLALVESGSIEAALIVALHIKQVPLALRVVRTIVSHNVDAVPLSLGLPSLLIDEARALYAHYRGDYWSEAGYQLAAKQFKRAHETIIGRVAPLCVVKGTPSVAREILGEINVSKVPDWSSGGQVYLDYISLCDSPTPLLVMRLSTSLKQLRVPTRVARVALSMMADHVASIQDNLTPAQVLSLPLSSSNARVQALDQAATLLG